MSSIKLSVVHKTELGEFEFTNSLSYLVHQEIEDIIVLKNNKGSEDNRVRKLDYSIQISKLFYERFINEQEISLFSPHDIRVDMMRGARQSLMSSTKKQKEKQVSKKQK